MSGVQIIIVYFAGSDIVKQVPESEDSTPIFPHIMLENITAACYNYCIEI